MSYLIVAYKGAHSNRLYTAYFDGTTWHGNTMIKDQPGGISPQSDQNPGTCRYQNRLYLVYKGAGEKDLYMASTDGTTWFGDIRISSMPGGISPQSDGAPSLVEFNGLLYAVYKGAGTNDIYTAWFDGTTWYGDTRVGASGGISPQTNYGVDAVVYMNRLFLVYKGAHSNTLYTATFDGRTWSGNTRIKDQGGGLSPESNYNPGTVVYNGLLYLIYKGAHSNDLYTANYDGSTWRGNTTISGSISPQTNYCPRAIWFQNRIYTVYKGAHSNTLYSAWYDGTRWSGNVEIADQPGGISPECNYNPEVSIAPVTPGTMASWLRAVPDSILVCDINLPGTHDSAAINSVFYTLFACQAYTITQQLLQGIRLLDVRLKVIRSGGTYTFVTCHGDRSGNEYQSFASLLVECRDFLRSNPSEFMAMSLKIDDWNGVTESGAQAAALDVLKQMVKGWKGFAAMPTLGQVRGKIYLLNRINTDTDLGAVLPVWPDSTCGYLSPPVAGQRDFELYVQDDYRNLSTFSARDDKLEKFTGAWSKAMPGRLLLNFASGTTGKLFGVYIMGLLLQHLGDDDAGTRRSRLGWSLFDYASTPYQTDRYGFVNVIQLIISSNFGYAAYPRKFKVNTGGQDEL